MRQLNLVDRWRRVISRDSGQDLLEYVLLVALIAMVAVGTVSTLGTTVRDVFWDVIASSTGDI